MKTKLFALGLMALLAAPVMAQTPAPAPATPYSVATTTIGDLLDKPALKAIFEKHLPEIVANLSTLYRLMPGDLIFTGTPEGVGPVKPGDTMVASIEGVGTFRAEVVASAPTHPSR